MVGPGVAGPVDPDPTSTHTQKGAFWKQLGELRPVVKDAVQLCGSVLILAATQETPPRQGLSEGRVNAPSVEHGAFCAFQVPKAAQGHH